MPELPEVETIKNDLNQRIVGKKINKLIVHYPGIIKGDIGFFKKTLVGNKFKKISRRGKLLVFELSRGGLFLLIHLKMTGQLVYCKGNDIVVGGHGEPEVAGCAFNKYTHVIFEFANGFHLFFNDLRKFGYLKLVNAKEKEEVLSKFGFEPFDKEFTVGYLREILKNRKTDIKKILLNQQLIAGIGNIYADEILFDAGVLPNRIANTLTIEETKKIHQASRRILKKAIKYRGTTFSDYVDTHGKRGGFTRLLKVYGRVGEPCLKCRQGVIKKTKIAGRGTSFCSICQK